MSSLLSGINSAHIVLSWSSRRLLSCVHVCISSRKYAIVYFKIALWCGPRIASLHLPRYVVRGD